MQTAPTARNDFRIPLLALCISLCGLSVRASSPPPTQDALLGSSLNALAYYIEMASYPDDDIRLQAMDEIRRLGRHALPAKSKLIEILNNDPLPTMRAAAANTLAAIRTSDAVPGLIRALDDPDKRVRKSAADALGSLESHSASAVSRLAAIAKDEHTEVRIAAIRALGWIGESAEPAVPFLIEIVNGKNPKMSAEAAIALGGIGPNAKSATPSLIRVLREVLTSAPNDEGASSGQSKTSSSIGMQDEDIQTVLGSAALQGICGIGPAAKDAIPLLRDILRDEDDVEDRTLNVRPNSLKAVAAWALLSVQPKSEEPIEQVAEGLLRVHASYSSESLFPDLPYEPLNQSLIFNYSDLQNFSSYSYERGPKSVLGEALKEPKAAEAVAETIIRKIPQLEAREQAAAFHALCSFGPRAAPVVPELIQMVTQSGPRDGAIAVLAHIGPEASKVADELSQLLALGRTGGEDSLYGTNLMWAYARVLGPKKGTKFLSDLAENEDDSDTNHLAMKLQAIKTLGFLGEDARTGAVVLGKIATDENLDPRLRRAAARSLQRLGPAAAPALPVLVKSLDGLPTLQEEEYDYRLMRERWTSKDSRRGGQWGDDTNPLLEIIPIFGTIGPEASEAIPKLKEALIWRTEIAWSTRAAGGFSAPRSAELASQTLTRIDPDNYFFYYTILGSGPATQRTVWLLNEILSDPAQSEWHIPAIEVVYQVGYENRSRELDGDYPTEDYRQSDIKLEIVPFKIAPLAPILTHHLRSKEKLICLRTMGFFHWNWEYGVSAIPALIELLHSEDADIQREALETLGKVSISRETAIEVSEEHLVKIAALIESPDTKIQQSAFQALGRAGFNSSSVAELLKSNLKHENSKRREWAAQAFQPSWKAKCDRAELLINAIRESDDVTRGPLIDALGSVATACNDPRIFDVMFAVLDDEGQPREERGTAVRAMAHMRPMTDTVSRRLSEIAQSDPPNYLSEDAQQSLERSKDPDGHKSEVEQWMRLQKDPMFDGSVQAVVALGNLGPAAQVALPMLLEDLQNIEWHRGGGYLEMSGSLMAELTAEAIFKIAPEEYLPIKVLIGLSDRSESKAAYRARKMLDQVGSASIAAILKAASTEDFAPWACEKVATFTSADASVAPQFLAGLKSEFPAVRKASLIGLSRVARDQPETITAITAMLDDPDLWVRLAAVGALDFMRAEMTSSITTLEKIASSGARSHTLAVIETLTALHDIPDGADRLLNDWTTHEDDDIRNSARDAIRHHGRLD